MLERKVESEKGMFASESGIGRDAFLLSGLASAQQETHGLMVGRKLDDRRQRSNKAARVETNAQI